MESDAPLAGKRALVTGGNSGIGEAIALELSRAGADVAINYRAHREVAADVVDLIERSGVRGLALRADVSSPQAVAAMFQELDHQWGGLDIFVRNAGVDGPRASARESDPAQWERVLRVNLIGAYFCMREALRRMVGQRSGVIVAISSVHEVIPWSGYSAYAASKAGLGMLVRTMAQEAAPFGVRVFSIAPGVIATPINRDVWSQAESRQDLEAKIPLGRIGSPAEIARLLVALTGDTGSYVTGTTVFADGGMTDYRASGGG